MILDKELEFSDSQAVTASAISTNVVDLGAVPTLRDMGAGETVWLVIQVDTDADSAADGASVAFSLESDSTADLATSATVHFTTAAIAEASLTAGTLVAAIALPRGVTYERYLGVRYTVTGESLTAGAFSAYIVKDVQSWFAYPDSPSAT